MMSEAQKRRNYKGVITEIFKPPAQNAREN